MAKNKVKYCFCRQYDPEEIKNLIEEIFLSFPDLIEKLNSGSIKNILVKPNLLAARHPDKAVTTHPEVLIAIINYLKQFNCNITIADTPAGTYNPKALEKLYKECQINKVTEQTGCTLNFDCSDVSVVLPHGKVLKKTLLIKPALDADLIINVPKLKTHALTRLTCASKNLYGLMPGILKFRQHLAMPDLKVFGQMILDINTFFEGKVFNIVDGIIGMEGMGPGSGDPKFAGALLGGWDSGSLDVLACYIMGIQINTVPTLMNYTGMEDIEIIDSDEVSTCNFELPPVRYRVIPDFVPEWVENFICSLTIAKPVIIKKYCKKCKICIEACPAQIITMEESGACINDYKNCIKCYCCQESCPYKAIDLSKPLLDRIFRFIRSHRQKR